MKQMNRKLFISTILAIFILISLSFAQTGSQQVSSINRVGTTAGQFLKIGAGARPIGMGGAYSALATDILAVYWNPAGLAKIVGNGEATFNHSDWLAETDFDFAAFSLNLGTIGSVGGHITSFRTPEQAVRTIDNPEGTGQMWDANMVSLGLTYAKVLTDRFSIGFTAKYIQETIFNVTSKGAAVDIGILYNTPVESITLAAAISNFGTKLKLDGRDLFFNEDPAQVQGSVDEVPAEFRMESFDMPLIMRFGLAWEAFRDRNFQLTLVADGTQPNDNSEHINSGVELGIKNVLFLRGGYKALFLEDSEQGPTFGAGLQYDAVGTNLNFDFGWADYGRLENVKFVSFAIRY